MSARLCFNDVRFRYGPAPVLDGVTLDLPRGTLAALIGPNGSGKTTMLNLASGTRSPTTGQVTLDGQSIRDMTSVQRARRVALVPQTLTVPFAFSVREMVGFGRTPYLHPLRGERAADRAAVEWALHITDTAQFANRSIHDLSGGERQRVILAMALAQEPDLLLLDEPTANLDVAHQTAILQLVRDLNRERGVTVLAAIHDLNLAALYFDHLVALASGKIIAAGSPGAVLTTALIRDVYGSTVQILDHPSAPVPLVVLTPDLRRATVPNGANHSSK